MHRHNDKVVLMVPALQPDGNLPAGIHWAEWAEFEARFGQTAYRRSILAGLRQGIEQLKAAGCEAVYVDGSFVTAKPQPGDFDACWDVTNVNPSVLDPVFLDFANHSPVSRGVFSGAVAEWDQRKDVP